MKVRYIKSATVVIEHGGKKVLCDPWLADGAYYGSWYHWPPLKFSAADFQDIDYIYISHVHPDHCDAETLKGLPKDKPVLICDFHEKFLLNTLKRAGFQNIIEVPNRGTYELGPDFRIEILAGDDANSGRFALVYSAPSTPTFEKSTNIDSMAIFSGGGKVVANTNDVPIALINGACPYLLQKYGEIDLLLVSYAGAGPYPQAHEMERGAMADCAIRSAYSYLGGTVTYIQQLRPRYYLPYAGQYTLGGKNHWMNSYKGTFELDELLSDLVPMIEGKGYRSEMVLLDSGETFDLGTCQASAPFTPTNFIERRDYIKNVLSRKQYDYEKDDGDPQDVLDRVEAAVRTLRRKQEEFRYFTDASVYIDTGLPYFYKVPFDGDSPVERAEEVKPDKIFIRARLDHRLFNRILDRRANWNNAEVGSHVTLTHCVPQAFYEKTRRSMEPMLHFMLAYLQEPRTDFARAKEPAAVGKGEQNVY